MAYTTINKSTAHFNTKLYTGNSNGSNSQTISVGMAPNWTWIKPRGATGDHRLFDTVRGVYKDLVANGTAGQANSTTSLTAFNSDGFVVGSENGVNSNNDTFVSWNWKESAAGGLDIISYTGTGSNINLSHNLSAIPDWIMIKARSGTDAWRVYSKGMGYDKRLVLSEAGGSSTSAIGLDAEPTSSVINIGTDTACTNQNGKTYICYAFKNVQGYSKSGRYRGNGNADGTFVYTGFKPTFILVKRTNGSENWTIMDSARDPSNVAVNKLHPNTNGGTDAGATIDILSNGFKNRTTNAGANGSGDSYIYMAFGQSLVGTNNIPATAR